MVAGVSAGKHCIMAWLGCASPRPSPACACDAARRACRPVPYLSCRTCRNPGSSRAAYSTSRYRLSAQRQPVRQWNAGVGGWRRAVHRTPCKGCCECRQLSQGAPAVRARPNAASRSHCGQGMANKPTEAQVAQKTEGEPADIDCLIEEALHRQLWHQVRQRGAGSPSPSRRLDRLAKRLPWYLVRSAWPLKQRLRAGCARLQHERPHVYRPCCPLAGFRPLEPGSAPAARWQPCAMPMKDV